MDPEPNQGAKASSVAAEASAGASGPGESASGSQPEMGPSSASAARKKTSRTRPKAGTYPNNVRKLRQGAMMSKAELARRAGVSPLTIDRVEAGCPCRMDTKRKILEALGLQPAAAKEVFPDVDLG